MYNAMGSSTAVTGGTAAVLAHTGASVTAWIVAAALLVAVGAVFVLRSHRRAGRDKSTAGA